MNAPAATSTTYVEVLLKVEHAAVIGDVELFTVVDQAFRTVVALVANEHGANLCTSADYVAGYESTDPIAVLRTGVDRVRVRLYQGSSPEEEAALFNTKGQSTP